MTLAFAVDYAYFCKTELSEYDKDVSCVLLGFIESFPNLFLQKECQKLCGDKKAKAHYWQGDCGRH